MAERTQIGRRTALTTLGAAAATATGLAGAAGATTDEPDPASRDDGLTGVYDGTVDRIVDGEHVVVLIEEGGAVIDQQVVSADEYPGLDEGEAVTVFLYRGEVLVIW